MKFSKAQVSSGLILAVVLIVFAVIVAVYYSGQASRISFVTEKLRESSEPEEYETIRECEDNSDCSRYEFCENNICTIGCSTDDDCARLGVDWRTGNKPLCIAETCRIKDADENIYCKNKDHCKVGSYCKFKESEDYGLCTSGCLDDTDCLISEYCISVEGDYCGSTIEGCKDGDLAGKCSGCRIEKDISDDIKNECRHVRGCLLNSIDGVCENNPYIWRCTMNTWNEEDCNAQPGCRWENDKCNYISSKQPVCADIVTGYNIDCLVASRNDDWGKLGWFPYCNEGECVECLYDSECDPPDANRDGEPDVDLYGESLCIDNKCKIGPRYSGTLRSHLGLCRKNDDCSSDNPTLSSFCKSFDSYFPELEIKGLYLDKNAGTSETDFGYCASVRECSNDADCNILGDNYICVDYISESRCEQVECTSNADCSSKVPGTLCAPIAITDKTGACVYGECYSGSFSSSDNNYCSGGYICQRKIVETDEACTENTYTNLYGECGEGDEPLPANWRSPHNWCEDNLCNRYEYYCPNTCVVDGEPDNSLCMSNYYCDSSTKKCEPGCQTDTACNGYACLGSNQCADSCLVTGIGDNSCADDADCNAKYDIGWSCINNVCSRPSDSLCSEGYICCTDYIDSISCKDESVNFCSMQFPASGDPCSTKFQGNYCWKAGDTNWPEGASACGENMPPCGESKVCMSTSCPAGESCEFNMDGTGVSEFTCQYGLSEPYCDMDNDVCVVPGKCNMGECVQESWGAGDIVG